MYILGSMKTVVSIKLDEEVKKGAQAIARDSGLTLSALVNSYLTQVISTRRIEIYAPEPMTPKLEKLIAEVESEIQSGKISKGFTDVNEFLSDLKK